ncbi:hypothetical protein ONZ45_g9460 [Pleurotus djamor]|nr:hypothetical protein ONZ45_g9460 [Pleurotus djamor]
MGTLPRRLARAKQLIRLYRNARKASSHRLRQRKRDLLRHLRHLQFPSPSDDDLSSLSSFDDFSTSPSSSSSETSTTDWSAILGTNWRDIGDFSDISNSLSEDFDIDQSILLSSSSDGSSSDPQIIKDFESDLDMMDCDADDEDSDESYGSGSEMGEEFPGPCPVDRWARLRMWVFHNISDMYAQRYELPRDPFPRGPSYLHHVLRLLKNSRPDHFRQELRVSPQTFDAIVAAIETNAVFFNNSQNAQLPIEEQLAITLYRFGHDGNAASLQSVANWAGVGKGTVLLATRRVMTAILHPNFMKKAVRFPTDEEKAEAKQWVRRHSCKGWKDGWCFVDGTLIPFAERPHWFGESYFDRKNRLSPSPTFASLISDLDTLVALTTQRHGKVQLLPLIHTITFSLVNGFGLIQHIRSALG